MLKIAVLDMYEGYANEGMRCIRQLIQDFLSKEGIEGKYEVFDVRLKNELPDLSYDVFISSGGPGSPLPSDAEWEKNYFKLNSSTTAKIFAFKAFSTSSNWSFEGSFAFTLK